MSLELATTNELWDELSSRYNACVIIHESAARAGSDTFTDINWKGSFCHMLGLMDYGKVIVTSLKKQYDESPDT